MRMNISEVKISILKIPVIIIFLATLSTQVVWSVDFERYKLSREMTDTEKTIKRISNKILEIKLMNDNVVNVKNRSILIERLKTDRSDEVTKLNTLRGL